MKQLLKPLFVLLCVSTISACAVKPNNYIQPQAREHINEIDSYLIVPQDEIYADIVRSQTTAAMGGGLLFALIDSAVDNSRTKDAEALTVPIRDALIDFDFADVLKNELADVLTTSPETKVKKLELERYESEGQFAEKLRSSSADAVLFITADYKLTASLDSVQTSVSLIMFPNNESLLAYREKIESDESLVDKNDNIYRNELFSTVWLNGNGDNPGTVAMLVENSGQKVREALIQSAQQVAKQIKEDLLKSPTPE